jgi:short-subunit dehydrogenase
MAERRRGEGQTALVTGASMGIGVDLAECFARDGYDLVLAARSEDALKAVAARLSSAYRVRATPIAVDLAQPGSGEWLAAKITACGFAVDVLVNNAGYGVAGAFDGSDRAGQIGMIDLNDRALVELTHIYWPRFLANKRGGVLNVASTAAFQPGPLMAVYYASKAFVLSFSEALWKEAEGTGVHVSCLCPGSDGQQVPGARRNRPDASGEDRRADGFGRSRRHGVSRVGGESSRRRHRHAQCAGRGAGAVRTKKNAAYRGAPTAESRLSLFIGSYFETDPSNYGQFRVHG